MALGAFEQSVLMAAYRLGEDDAYGPNIYEELEARLKRKISAGAMYTTLDRLRRDGLLRSRLEAGPKAPGGRSRRYYAVTASGISALNESRSASDALWAGLIFPIRWR